MGLFDFFGNREEVKVKADDITVCTCFDDAKNAILHKAMAVMDEEQFRGMDERILHTMKHYIDKMACYGKVREAGDVRKTLKNIKTCGMATDDILAIIAKATANLPKPTKMHFKKYTKNAKVMQYLNNVKEVEPAKPIITEVCDDFICLPSYDGGEFCVRKNQIIVIQRYNEHYCNVVVDAKMTQTYRTSMSFNEILNRLNIRKDK